jgi:hypothetical protein
MIDSSSLLGLVLRSSPLGGLLHPHAAKDFGLSLAIRGPVSFTRTENFDPCIFILENPVWSLKSKITSVRLLGLENAGSSL